MSKVISTTIIILLGFAVMAPTIARADCYDDALVTVTGSDTPNNQSSLSSTSKSSDHQACPTDDTSDE
jgi:hypothetical protein